MTVQQTLDFFDITKVNSKLQAMSDVVPDYLTLDHP